MNARTQSLPKYRLHKPFGQVVVTLCGRDFYLGAYGTPASVEAYNRRITEWLSNNRTVAPRPQQLTVHALCEIFKQHADAYYLKPDGTLTSEPDNYRQALRPLEKVYGTLLARDFGPKALRGVRQEMIRLGWCR